jgi:Putative zinc dependent peptidase (DUF5700)
VFRSLLLLPFLASSLFCQFDVTLQLDFTSAEKIIEVAEGSEGNVRRVAELPGNQIAAATSMVLARREVPPEAFISALEALRARFKSSDDLFGLWETQTHLGALKSLLVECKRRPLDRRVVGTIAQFFPEQARIAVSIPVYFVAMGHENAAAYVRRVMWQGKTPVFVGGDQGEAVIVVDLVRSVQYSTDVQTQFISMLSTLAHEAFHAVFSAYQASSPAWQRIHAGENYFDILGELVQNEGIAYYLSMQEQLGGTFPSQLTAEIKKLVPVLDDAFDELRSPQTSPSRARALILNANLSGSLEKNYGAGAGLLMAYEIDTKLGRKALSETIALGPADFFAKYNLLTRQYPDLPPLSAYAVTESKKR